MHLFLIVHKNHLFFILEFVIIDYQNIVSITLAM